MSNIKNIEKRNDDDELSKYHQNVETVVCQESDATFKKIIQSETRNDNKKIFSHKFSENNAINYAAFVEKKRARNKNLKVKREYQILLKRNKRLQTSFRDDKISVLMKCKRSAA